MYMSLRTTDVGTAEWGGFQLLKLPLGCRVAARKIIAFEQQVGMFCFQQMLRRRAVYLVLRV
jgi:hypothetical protein